MDTTSSLQCEVRHYSTGVAAPHFSRAGIANGTLVMHFVAHAPQNLRTPSARDVRRARLFRSPRGSANAIGITERGDGPCRLGESGRATPDDRRASGGRHLA